MPFGNDSGFPLSDEMVRRWSQRGYMHDFLKAQPSLSRSFECHDFTRSIAADVTNVWTVGATSTATTWAVLAEPGGWIRGATGASIATAGLQLSAPNAFWNGTKGCGFASLIRLSAVTGIRIEQGFANALPAVSTPLVNLASNAFSSTTTAAVALYDDGSASTAVSGLYTVGASTAFNAVATTTNQYASGVTLFVAVEVDGTTVRMWAGNPSAPPTTYAGALEEATALIPFISVKGLAGASKNVDIDTIWRWTIERA